MDGVELDLVCPCGYENFERVVVHRRPRPSIVTDFVACVGCKAMYWAPLRRSGSAEEARAPPIAAPPAPTQPAPGLKSWGGVLPVYRQHEQSPEELQALKDAAARANRV
jgi:hypothetical protein